MKMTIIGMLMWTGKRPRGFNCTQRTTGSYIMWGGGEIVFLRDKYTNWLLNTTWSSINSIPFLGRYWTMFSLEYWPTLEPLPILLIFIKYDYKEFEYCFIIFSGIHFTYDVCYSRTNLLLVWLIMLRHCPTVIDEPSSIFIKLFLLSNYYSGSVEHYIMEQNLLNHIRVYVLINRYYVLSLWIKTLFHILKFHFKISL